MQPEAIIQCLEAIIKLVQIRRVSDTDRGSIRNGLMAEQSIAQGFGIHTVEATSKHTQTAILLHGRGSNGREFAEEFFESVTSRGLNLRQHLPNWRWLFPTARERYSTVFQEELHEWFDVYSLTDPLKKFQLQREGLVESITFVSELINQELQLVPSECLILGGISQGCATGLHALMSGHHALGGFVGFCGWLPMLTEVRTMASTASEQSLDKAQIQASLDEIYRTVLGLPTAEAASSWSPRESLSPLDTPIFLSHNSDDAIVDHGLGEQACDVLNMLNLSITWRSYPEGGHWIREPEGFDDLLYFLQENVCQKAR